jgi:hypothetical protein
LLIDVILKESRGFENGTTLWEISVTGSTVVMTVEEWGTSQAPSAVTDSRVFQEYLRALIVWIVRFGIRCLKDT